MPKKNRLSGTQIRRMRAPRKIHGSLFSVAISPLEGKTARFACVVSKRVAMKATVRNLIKRRCRAALAAHRALLPGAYVFTAKKDAAIATYADIKRDVESLVKSLVKTSAAR